MFRKPWQMQNMQASHDVWGFPSSLQLFWCNICILGGIKLHGKMTALRSGFFKSYFYFKKNTVLLFLVHVRLPLHRHGSGNKLDRLFHYFTDIYELLNVKSITLSHKTTKGKESILHLFNFIGHLHCFKAWSSCFSVWVDENVGC